MAYKIYDINALRELTIATNLRFYITKWMDMGYTSKTFILTLVQKHYDEDDLQYASTLLNSFSKSAIIDREEREQMIAMMYS